MEPENGTWDDVIAANENTLREFELRVVRNQYRELRLNKEIDGRYQLFTIGKGNVLGR